MDVALRLLAALLLLDQSRVAAPPLVEQSLLFLLQQGLLVLLGIPGVNVVIVVGCVDILGGAYSGFQVNIVGIDYLLARVLLLDHSRHYLQLLLLFMLLPAIALHLQLLAPIRFRLGTPVAPPESAVVMGEYHISLGVVSLLEGIL